MAVSCDGLKEMLQSAVQSVQWTYIIFWQLCPQQRVLVWRDGYYNGAIKTRKTVQSVEVSTEEAALCRSEQLRELYDSLATGDQQATENQQSTIRRPSVALSPEDLTESEWFYLVCVSFSFPPGVGLVGGAYAKQQHLWLIDAHEAESTVFTRAILAKSADIQTVICIPLLNGVVELGTTEKVKESIDFVQHVKHFFMVENDNIILQPPRPALSAHSSNSTLSSHHISLTNKPPDNPYSMDEDDTENEEEDDDDDDEEEEGDDEEKGSDIELELGHISSVQESYQDTSIMKANELLQLDMSTDIRFGSPTDSSSNLDSRFQLLATSQDDSCRAESAVRWSDNNLELHNTSTVQLQKSETLQPEPAPEDTHYSSIVSTILHKQPSQWDESHPATSLHNTQSSFTPWKSNHHRRHTASNSQWLLKYMLFTVPFLHSNTKSVEADASESVGPPLRKTTSHEELSANHVLAERRRREKLNERFMILRSLVPLVTKMDKASILGDTIEYVKQLRKKIQDLETRDRQETVDRSKVLDKRKIRVVEAGSGRGRKTARAVQVEVSIIESDALVELQCPHREGLLLDVMKKLRELGVEITTVQSCVDDGTCTAEMRAKVKVKSNNGKKLSIMQAKKAINQIISPLLITP